LTTSQVSTQDLNSGADGGPASTSANLYPARGPEPAGTRPEAAEELEKETLEHNGAGIEGEEPVWEGRYVLKNFVGRLVWRVLATIASLALVTYTWGYNHRDLIVPATIFGVFMVAAWLTIAYRMIFATYGHFYRLTTRRLFVSTGMLQRRRDQMELLRVADVFTRQNWVERLLSLGTVVVVSSEKALPTIYLPGVSDPKRVMDLIWHYARAERDRRSIKVQDV